MKNKFFEYYHPSEHEINEAWIKATFTFDSNALLNLYRYTQNTRDVFFKILENVSFRTKIVHEAANRFHKNRQGIIQSQGIVYKIISNFLKKNENVINEVLIDHIRYSCMETDFIRKLLNQSLDIIYGEIEKSEKLQQNFTEEDTILDNLTKIFDDSRIGDPYSDDKLEDIFEIGKERYSKQIAPGYINRYGEKTIDDHVIYSDLILWFQLIDEAKKSSKPIILITDELKEDWWEKSNDNNVSVPRRELLKEFYDQTKQKIYFYTFEHFIDIAMSRYINNVDDSIILEIFDMKKKDRELRNNNKFFYLNS